MSNFVRTASVKKPAEYKEYVNFLHTYKNGKRDDQNSVVSSDSGVQSPLDGSLDGSSASLNYDSNETTSETDSCVRMKIEICIDMNQPKTDIKEIEQEVSKAVTQVESKPAARGIQRSPSVKKISEIFESNNNETNKVSSPNQRIVNKKKILNKVNKNKCPIPPSFNHKKPTLEKLLLIDNQGLTPDTAKPDILSPKPLLSPTRKSTKDKSNITASGKPSLEQLLLEDKKNSTQNIGNEVQETIPAEASINKLVLNDNNDTVTINKENIFTSIRKNNDDDDIVPNIKVQITQELPTQQVFSPPPPPPPAQPSFVNSNSSSTIPCPPPPPPMPAVLPTIKASVIHNNKVVSSTFPSNKKTEKEMNDFLENEKKKLAYGTLRGLCNAYHEKANGIVNTLPRGSVNQNRNIQNIIQTIASQGGLDKLCGRAIPKEE